MHMETLRVFHVGFLCVHERTGDMDMRYKAIRIVDVNWGVQDTVTGEYVTAWRSKDACKAIADELNRTCGQEDYREVMGLDDPEEIGVAFDDIAYSAR